MCRQFFFRMVCVKIGAGGAAREGVRLKVGSVYFLGTLGRVGRWEVCPAISRSWELVIFSVCMTANYFIRWKIVVSALHMKN